MVLVAVEVPPNIMVFGPGQARVPGFTLHVGDFRALGLQAHDLLPGVLGVRSQLDRASFLRASFDKALNN